MYRVRAIDNTESKMVDSGKANFLASSAGHEGVAILAEYFIKDDWLHCHYRDKALMHARGIKPIMFFYNSLCKAEGMSNGRQMVIGMSDRSLNIVSVVTPVGNQSLPATGIAHVIKDEPNNPIVYCGMGDGTTQQGEVFEALAEVRRHSLPVLFVVQDNGQAISTRTEGKTFFSLPDGSEPNEFMGIPITHLDGTRPFEMFDEAGQIINKVRKKSPQIIILKTVRLNSHSNADDHRIYRSLDELQAIKHEDPVEHGRKYLVGQGVAEQKLREIENKCDREIEKAAELSLQGNTPEPCFNAEQQIPYHLLQYKYEYRGNFSATKRLGMKDAMREVFRSRLKKDNKVYLLGQDIEDEKGDVFGVTKGLSTQFPGRVVNAPLSEATIVGVCIGMALTGKRPVAFVQFADFMPSAYNQIFTELATMYWRSNGDWNCPTIIFAACGGYRPGLGPFHAQTNEGTYAHIPGIDVYMPSNAADAAGMLNAAFESNRPSIFLYPKKLLNNTSINDTTSTDIDIHLVPIGKARVVKSGSDITLVGWGNTVSLCCEVSDTLASVGVSSEVIDIRTIKPYDLKTILSSAEKTGHLIVTHEDNMTCGLGGEIIASVIEKAKIPIKVKRITRPDTYVPCNFENQMEILPSFERILSAVAEILSLSIKWEVLQSEDSDSYNVEVIGSSPSDESILITDLHVKVGDEIKVGDKLVDMEASKSVGEILSPINGRVEEIYFEEADRATVGTNLLKLSLPKGVTHNHNQRIKRRPIIEHRKNLGKVHQTNNTSIFPVGITIPSFRMGSKRVTNEMLLKRFPQHTNSDIVNRTGIKERYWLNDNENIVDLAANVVTDSLNKENLVLSDVDQIICATCSPDRYLSPSMACLILEKLYHKYGEHDIPAYDINAACSGYIYALQSARDYLQTRPDKRILIVTAEYMSKRINLDDFDTAFLFADAATSTIVSGHNYQAKISAVINEISLTATGENGNTLNIPMTKGEYTRLKGKRLFNFAVKNMSTIMSKCCQQGNTALNNIDLVIPHQANQRISNAVEKRLKINPGTLHSNIAHYGNTSSCTIPIALAETLSNQKKNSKIALCAFGSGFTAAAAILTKTK
jgi:2-oxoisovalerate dehydrogenase E1 component